MCVAQWQRALPHVCVAQWQRTLKVSIDTREAEVFIQLGAGGGAIVVTVTFVAAPADEERSRAEPRASIPRVSPAVGASPG